MFCRSRSTVVRGAIRLPQAVEQQRAEIERHAVEPQAEALDPSPLLGDLGGAPRAVGLHHVAVWARVDDDALAAELRREAQPVVGRVDQLLADVHARPCYFTSTMRLISPTMTR